MEKIIIGILLVVIIILLSKISFKQAIIMDLMDLHDRQEKLLSNYKKRIHNLEQMLNF